MVPGVHARLEMISEQGTWLCDHSYEYGGVEVVRKKGEKVGAIMASWRELRQQQPDLFREKQVLIWQSPTAYVDSVIYSWQQDEESGRFEPLARLVDALSTHWSQQAQERNFLSQTVQASVPAGCTPLVQLTDTALAAPAKAAARLEHERQKRLFLLKASQEKARAVFKSGAREMLLTALAMHRKMVDLNQTRQTVLSEFRAAGWAHYRPQGGSLIRCSQEAWAQNLAEGSGKLGPNFWPQREDHVDEEGKPLVDDGPPQPEVLEEDYFLTEQALLLEGEQEVWSLVEQRQFEAALLHPSVRAEVDEELAELALVTSQKSKRARSGAGRAAKKPKVCRREAAKEWRAALGGKTVAARLASLVPHSKGAKKKLAKHLFKMKLGKMAKKKFKKKVERNT